MATKTATEPQQLEVHLRALVLALHANVDDHPLLELGDAVSTYILVLIKEDPAHKIDEKRYRGFYSTAQDIVKHFEDIRAKGNPNVAHGRLPSYVDKCRLARLKKRLNAKYNVASKMPKPAVCKWEDGLILAGSVTSTISAGPGLDLLKPVGTVLSQIGELVKTIRGNKAEYADLYRLVAGILADLTSKVQRNDVKPTEDMERRVEDFERALTRIRDSIAELGRESRTKRWSRLVFANKAKEELAGLRKELGDAHNRFMASVFPHVMRDTCNLAPAHDVYFRRATCLPFASM
ncbi:hypothetical protein AAF712_004868 [Marasmius tenuissimus]|uniref:Uncharacterized protein n=1 Tax=Marasmius tenuissimus TaxID=585030 RepID=A0ABR3A1Z0_9AGAR